MLVVVAAVVMIVVVVLVLEELAPMVVVTELMLELRAITLTMHLRTEVVVAVALAQMLDLMFITKLVMVVLESVLLDINYMRIHLILI